MEKGEGINRALGREGFWGFGGSSPGSRVVLRSVIVEMTFLLLLSKEPPLVKIRRSGWGVELQSCSVPALVELDGGRSFWLAMALFWFLFLCLFICLSVYQFSSSPVISPYYQRSRARTTIVKNAKTRVNITGENSEGEESRNQEIIMYVCCCCCTYDHIRTAIRTVIRKEKCDPIM